MKYIPYGRQYIDQNDKKFVSKSLANDLITTGPYVKKFENKLSKYLECKFSYVCSSGTAAIHLAMLSIGLKKNDVILMPSVNFIASYNMAKSMNLKVYLVDVDHETGQITPEKVVDCIKKNKLKKIKALIVMHHGGYPKHTVNFYNLKRKYNFFIIEDACHALGARYKHRGKFIKIGSCLHSDICTFSMHPVKTITSGEGGIITTNRSNISDKIKLFRNHGIIKRVKEYWKYDILNIGYNYRLSDINCALGLSQLHKISFFLNSRKRIYDKYYKELKNFNPYLKILEYSKNIKPSYHLFLININFKKLKKNKDHFFEYLISNKVLPQFHYIPIYKFSIYKEKKTKFIGAEKYYAESLSIPIFVSLKNNEQKKIITIIKKYFI
tara:strand:- start:2989 stop:4134 length:1146 start_codon:yes stop_codon:yes gene_type:complete